MSLMVRMFAQRADPGGTIAYLANNAKLHCNQRIVAGSVQYPGHLDKQLVKQVSADLRFYQQVTGKVVAKGHIYHVSLSASADNGQLSDARWGSIANDFMDGMRFTGPNLSPVRWTAINHGHNEAGADHIHIVMSLVRQNGRQVSLHNDQVRASALATKLEQKYALGVLQTRLALVGAGSVPFTGRESAEARDQERPEPQRVTLERDIRAMAAGARTEAGFVSLVRSSGILLAPYPRESGMVTGYSVALPPVEGAKPQWFGGGRLAKDLTLPQLRRRWPLNQAASQYAWRGKIDAEPEPEAATVTAEQATASLNDLGETLADPTPAEFAEVSHDLAGLLASASRELESEPGELAAASREVGAWAQPTVMPLDAPLLTRAGARLFIQGLDPSSERGRSIMFRQFAQTLFELYRLHQAQRLRVATKRQVGTMQDDANPAAEVMEDGTTLVATGSMLGVMQHAQRQQRRILAGGSDQPTGGDVAVKTKAKRFTRGGGDLWDRTVFSDARALDRSRRASITTRAKLERENPPMTPERLKQIEQLRDLSVKVGLPLDEETLHAVHPDQLARMALDYEMAAKDYGVFDVPTGTREDVVATKLVTHGGASTGAEADVFLAQLERRAQLREEAQQMAADTARRATEAPWVDPDVVTDLSPDEVAHMRDELTWVTDCAPLLSEQQVVDLNRKMHAAGIDPAPVAATPSATAPVSAADASDAVVVKNADEFAGAWSYNPKDPRNWDTAKDPISPRQQFRLAEAGFSAVEIQSLAGKGAASIVVGEYLGDDKSLPPSPERARKAYDRVQSDAIEAASWTLDPQHPAREADVPSQANTPKATPKAAAKPKPHRPKQ